MHDLGLSAELEGKEQLFLALFNEVILPKLLSKYLETACDFAILWATVRCTHACIQMINILHFRKSFNLQVSN